MASSEYGCLSAEIPDNNATPKETAHALAKADQMDNLEQVAERI